MILTSTFQKHLHKVKKCYPSADDFTQALLVMLVTNIKSGQQWWWWWWRWRWRWRWYTRDRVNVPRDMTIWAARRLREALEVTAAISGDNRFSQIKLWWLMTSLFDENKTIVMILWQYDDVREALEVTGQLQVAKRSLTMVATWKTRKWWNGDDMMWYFRWWWGSGDPSEA